MGRVDVDRLMGEMSAAQMREWEAFYRLEPFGNDWVRTAMLAMVMANINRNPEEKREPFEIEDFLPKFDGDADEEEATFDDEMDPAAQDEEPKWLKWKQIFALLAAKETEG